jgi:hypothetical protein
MQFDIGYGIKVDSLNCAKCGFNLTNDKRMQGALAEFRRRSAKEVKIIRIGEGLGIRFPNEVVKGLKLKKGMDVLLMPEEQGLKIVCES